MDILKEISLYFHIYRPGVILGYAMVNECPSGAGHRK